MFIEIETFLKRFLTRFLSSSMDIEDVLQDTFLMAFRAESDRQIHSPKAFLFRVARNAALKELTKKAHLLTMYIEDLDEEAAISDDRVLEDLVDARQKLGLFCQSAMEMPPRCRQAFLMAKVYGLSYKEISVELGIAVSTVEKHIARGLMICSEYVNSRESGFKSDTRPLLEAGDEPRGRLAPVVRGVSAADG